MIKGQKQPHFSKGKEHGVMQCRLKTVNVTSAPARGGPLPAPETAQNSQREQWRTGEADGSFCRKGSELY